LALAVSSAASVAFATDKALLDVLLENGLISQPQYDQLLEKEELTFGRAPVERDGV
jgi:aspartate ammonia-lyase